MKKQFLFREANGWTEILLKPGSERDFRQASQVVGVVLYPYKTVKYECYAVGIYFQMALLRQRTAQGSNAAEIEKKIKRGNALRQGSAWRGSRATAALLLVTVSVFVAALWLYVTSLDSDVTETLVSQAEFVSPQPRVYNIQCSEDYNNYKRYPGCTPQKCGRAVIDAVVSREEAQSLKRLAERGLALAGSEGGASILDLHSGALSMGRQFVNIYRYFGDHIGDVFTEEDFQLYRAVRGRIQAVIADTFGLDPKLMYLTKPTFFSRINSTTAKTQHDEYWHPHIDKVTYGSFDYTSLLYLSDYGSDFSGGRFIFMDQDSNSTVEPRAGNYQLIKEHSSRILRVVWLISTGKISDSW
ncbi:2-oxoglutarate and iron-dependent oxygenase domain-containing protein 3 isoform X2 [Takifugu rubripes]|uniref:2-oxoglutarate and iron-dependent oxygenase domain-containing protein 3 isoform X2 n=1 Tax=Takifugu rubripes TaxID=31033 RepID=UPI001145A872|nr:2-oxoglutarate and iron-dependent oxygenase domain-containing protein 3 isoform X2 [Takifugu rubripes]